MIYFLALLPATALTIGGYFVLYLSDRSEGARKTFGRYLGFWAFALAALVILGAIFAAASRPNLAFVRGGGPGYGAGPGFMMQGGPGFGRPGFFMHGFGNRFFRGPRAGVGRGPGDGRGPGGNPPGPQRPAAPAAPNAAPAPGGT